MTIPPLHPRCRCAIIYDEVAAPRAAQPKPLKPETKPETKPAPVINPLLIPVVSPKPKPEIGHDNQPEGTQNPSEEDRIKSVLQAKMTELKIKGELVYPLPGMDFSEFAFDAEHTQGDKHPHDVTEEEARKFIDDAYFTIVKYNGNSYNYYGKTGATFARLDLKTLRTSFKSNEYDDNIKALIEVYENEFH